MNNFDPTFQYKATQFGETNLITARGCPMQCAFCAVANVRATAQDTDLVIKQIDYIVEQHKKIPEHKKKDKIPTIAIQDNFFL